MVRRRLKKTEAVMAKTPEEGQRLIPYIQVGRLKRALPRLVERELAGGVVEAIDAATPWTMSIPDCGKAYFGFGRQKSYEVAYLVTNPSGD